jgi:hypothetical protein
VCQIESQGGVKRIGSIVSEVNPAVQMALPMAGMMGWLREGVGRTDSPGRAEVDAVADGKRNPATDWRTRLPDAGT